MLSPAEMALFLRSSAARAKASLEPVTKRLMQEAAEDARGMIGHYQDGWPKLADATKADRVRQRYSENDPLLRRGDLRDSIKGQAEATFEGAEGAVSSDSEIARVQELGSSRVPPRPFLSASLIRIKPKAEAEFGALAAELLTPGVR